MAISVSGLRYQYVAITSLDGSKKPIDITNSILGIDYYEDILSPCITMTMQLVNAYSIFNGLPIRGGESVSMQIETASGTFVLEGESAMFVTKLAGLDAEKQSESFTLFLSSKEGLQNETVRCCKKYNKANINTHINDILKNVLQTNKIGTIEPTSNSYSFIGNNKKPFHIMTWLGPKSVSTVSSQSGTSGKEAKGTAGFLFYENKDGFNFRSIDSLVSNTQLQSSSSNKENIFKYNYSGRGMIESNNLNNNFEILNYNYEQNIDLMKSLRVGMYVNKTYFYDMYNQELKIYKYSLKEELKNATKLGANESIAVSEQFGNSITRIMTRASDHGTLDTKGTFQESGRDNADMAKSFSRYNLLFTQALNMNVPCNVKLKAGDIIYAQFPKIEAGSSKEVDEEQSGNYLIKELRHHFSGGQMLTSLRLIRDSYGLYGPNQ
ncbi:MAG: Synechococcus phage [Bacteroidota bacterium]